MGLLNTAGHQQSPGRNNTRGSI